MGKIKGKRITDEELLNELKRIFNVCGFISKENIKILIIIEDLVQLIML